MRISTMVITCARKSLITGRLCCARFFRIMISSVCDDELFEIALNLFKASRDNKAVLADYLSRLQDDRALPALMAAAQDEDTHYLDYIELRSAIEKLGGECPEREFDEKDPMYEALQRMQ